MNLVRQFRQFDASPRVAMCSVPPGTLLVSIGFARDSRDLTAATRFGQHRYRQSIVFARGLDRRLARMPVGSMPGCSPRRHLCMQPPIPVQAICVFISNCEATIGHQPRAAWPDASATGSAFGFARIGRAVPCGRPRLSRARLARYHHVLRQPHTIDP